MQARRAPAHFVGSVVVFMAFRFISCRKVTLTAGGLVTLLVLVLELRSARSWFTLSEEKPARKEVKMYRPLKLSEVTGSNSRSVPLISSNISVEDMYQRLVYVSALSDNHFKEADMYRTIINCLPNNKLIIFDLGLNRKHKRELSSIKNVEVRPFPYNRYTHLPHVKNLFTYAWKGIAANIVAEEHDIIMYGDSSVRLLSCDLTAPLKHLLHFPFFSGAPGRRIAIQYTHDGMIKYLCFPTSRKDMANISSFQGGVWLMWATDEMKEKLLKPWLDCSLQEQCISPKGAKRSPCSEDGTQDGHYVGCHRYDQSAINLILAREFGLEYYFKGTNITISSSIWTVKRI